LLHPWSIMVKILSKPLEMWRSVMRSIEIVWEGCWRSSVVMGKRGGLGFVVCYNLMCGLPFSFPLSSPLPLPSFSSSWPIYLHAFSLLCYIITYPAVHASPHLSYFRYLPCCAHISSLFSFPLPTLLCVHHRLS
jgi:hypothetical protein